MAVSATIEIIIMRFGSIWDDPPEMAKAPALVCMCCKRPIESVDSGIVISSRVDGECFIGYHYWCAVVALW